MQENLSTQEKPLRLLSLDGGGIRGLSQLVILDEIMKRIQVDEGLQNTPRPCDYFDLIGGTGTGGLNALLLGRLGLTAEEAIKNYASFASQVFSEKKVIGKDGLFKASKFEEAIKDIVKTSTGYADEVMLDSRPPGQACKTFVCAMPAHNMSFPHLFRTYKVRENQTYNCMIWEAARATCASPSLFKRIAIGDKGFEDDFIDAGMKYNNPTKLVLEEAASAFGHTHQVACVVSIGCGHREIIGLPSPDTVQRWLPSYFLGTLKNIAEDCETTAEDVQKQLQNLMNVYFRFSVEQGMQNISLEEWARLGETTQHTKQYLLKTRVNQEINQMVLALLQRTAAASTLEFSGRISGHKLDMHHVSILKARLRPSGIFTGREDILKTLKQFFSTLSQQACKQRIFVLFGLGGSGKTEIALKFLELSNNRFSVVYLLDSSTAETIKISLESIALQYGMRTMDDALQYLCDLKQEWLLLFDNFDDPNINLRDYLPSCLHGNILVTTRNKHCCQHAPQSNCEVSSMKPDEAVQLLITCAMVPPSNEAKNAALAISQELGNLALAIVQAGRYISQSCTLEEYCELYKRNRIELFKEDSKQKADDYKSTVYTTWNMSFQRLSLIAKAFLGICSFFHYDGISQDIFKWAVNQMVLEKTVLDDCTTNLLQHFQYENGDWDEKRFLRVIQELGTYSLISVNKETKLYSIHPLVHAWSQRNMSRESLENTEQCATKILSFAVQRTLHQKDYKFLRIFLCHLERIHAKEDLTADLASLNLFFSVMFHCGCWRQAERLQLQVLKIQIGIFGEEHPDTLRSMGDLGLTYGYLGQFNKAEILQSQVLELQKKILGEEHPDTLRSMGNSAFTFLSLGQFNKAEILQSQVVELQKKILGEEHPDTLKGMNQLALTYQSLGQCHKAENLQNQVLDLHKKMLGEEHPDTLTCMNNLAFTFGSLGQFSKAEILQSKVLELQKKILGEEHPDTLRSMNDLASACYSLGQFNKAEILHNQVLELHRKMLGEEHPRTLTSMHNLAATYNSLGQFHKAEILQNQVLELQKKILGEEHPDTLKSMNNIAFTFSSLGQFNKAEILLNHVFESYKKVLGEEHPDTLTSMNNLALVFGFLGQFNKAEILQNQVLELQKKILGEEHPDTLRSMGSWAVTFSSLGQFNKAEILQNQVIELQKKILGEEHPDTLRSMSQLALTYQFLGQCPKAEILQNQVLESHKKMLGEEHPDTLACMNNLAFTFGSLGQFNKAEILQNQVLELQKKILGEEHPDTLRSMNNLASTCCSLGQFNKAEILHNQVLELHRKMLGEEHPHTLTTMIKMAGIYMKHGQFQKAEMLQVQVVGLCKKVLGEEHPGTKGNKKLLDLIYNAQFLPTRREMPGTCLKFLTKMWKGWVPDWNFFLTQSR